MYKFRTTPKWALLYRLCGDYNPMHADEDFGKRAGFKAPFCRVSARGTSRRAACWQLDRSDPARFKAFRARFNNVVYSGDELETRMWKICSERGFDVVHFETVVKGKWDGGAVKCRDQAGSRCAANCKRHYT